MGHDIGINIKGRLQAGAALASLLEIWRGIFPSEDVAELDPKTGDFVIEATGELPDERVVEMVREFEAAVRQLLSGPGGAVVRDYDSGEWNPFTVVGIGRNEQEAALGELRARIELATDAILPDLPKDQVVMALHGVAHAGTPRLRAVASIDDSPLLVWVPASLSDEAAAHEINESRLAANIETANGEGGGFWEEFEQQVSQRGLVIVGEFGSIARLEADPWDRDDEDAVTPPAPCDDGPPRESVATAGDDPVRVPIGDYRVHPRLADELSWETKDAMGQTRELGGIGPSTPCGSDVRAVIDAFGVLADRLSATTGDDRVLDALAASCARTIDTYMFG